LLGGLFSEKAGKLKDTLCLDYAIFSQLSDLLFEQFSPKLKNRKRAKRKN